MSNENIDDEVVSSRISRRTLIKVGAIAGGAVWVAPVIDSFSNVAAAASAAPSTGLSFVTILICDSSTKLCYRMKFDLSCLTSSTTDVTTSTCTSGGCGTSPTDDHCEDPTLTAPSGYTISSSCASGITGTYLGSVSTGSPVFTITNGGTTSYTLAAWQSHRGTCCAASNCSGTSYGPSTPTVFGSGDILSFDEPPNSCSPKEACPS
jgi:hypothetical protein